LPIVSSDRELSNLLRTWFGEAAGVSVAAISPHPLFPTEEAFIAGAVPRRRDEFSTGRWCARQALEAIGVPPCAIPVGSRREPLWPPGTTGSITHAGGLCAAIALRATPEQGVGIDLLDLDLAGQLLGNAADLINNQEEESAARALIPPEIDSRALLFSAKESVIKAISARTARFVDFTEIYIKIEGYTFVALFGGTVSTTCGWWKASQGFLVTAALTGPR
jgi:4'-phosphopantetheinyl transferase EntD